MKYGVWLAVLTVMAAGPARSELPSAATFEGSGRACYGRLVLTPRTIAWTTPERRCPASAYAVVQPGVFRLKQSGRACRTPVIALRQHGPAGADGGWEALGYPSVQAFRANDDSSVLSCGLVRLK